ncbi:polysaccharide biosynthesis protein [Dyadobacter sp. NIV53]|uniref:polysaccharide biosynthesis protein n=1 Tax=Dyadobacter sp. NIV53 TaxID=2861765 RepID=UPI001C88D788|nr:polysaccharide biosynthesis protein [Dyadobacter sp. NIV53]
MEINTKKLLGREEIIIDTENIREEIYNKRILVTGAAGSIGRELVRQILLYKPLKLILVDASEIGIVNLQAAYGKFENAEFVLGNITDKKRMKAIFRQAKPQIVFHTAAYKHVSLLEHHPYEALRVNFFGTIFLADLSALNQVEKFIFVSTDKAVNPTSAMGFTKRLAEIYLQSCNSNNTSNTQFIITRFGNVLGSSGSVYPIFNQLIENRQPLTVTHREVSRYFMTVSEASQLVLEAAAIGKGGEILIFKMGEPVVISALANRMIKLAGFVPGKDIEIEYTGLRSGEKLHEDLLHDDETFVVTNHQHINIVNFSIIHTTDIHAIISQLRDAMKTANSEQLLSILKNSLRETSHSEFIRLPVQPQNYVRRM